MAYELNNPYQVNPPAMYEEYLHHIQYCEEGTSWLAGDKELEAKILCSILFLQYNLSAGFDRKIADIFMRYYKYPNDRNFKDAVDALRGHPFYYSEKDYPITPGMEHSQRLKHIKEK